MRVQQGQEPSRLARRSPAGKERIMALEPDQARGQYTEILLFVTGMGAGGFLVALLFAFAISGGFVHAA